ncbi:MAG TPA: hypothetical protein VIO15_01225 [Bacteroidales bacterium]
MWYNPYGSYNLPYLVPSQKIDQAQSRIASRDRCVPGRSGAAWPASRCAGQYACTFGPCTKDRHFIAPGQGFGLAAIGFSGCSLMM